jgi:glycosyltransferase involved in cell wall biosynthesis
MNIAMLVYEFPPRIVGGLGTYAQEIAPSIVKFGHDVTLFTLNDGKLLTKENWHGVEVHRPLIADFSDFYPTICPDLHGWGVGVKFFSDIMTYNVLSTTKLINDLIKKDGRRYDLVCAHDWLSFPGGLAIKKETGLPLVVHFHSTERGRALHGTGSPIINSLEAEAARRADLIITVSYAMRDELIGLKFPEAKIRVCWNGVDANKYDPSKIRAEEIRKLREKYEIKDDWQMILFVGRLVAVKGVDRMILAMPDIIKKQPKTKLVVVGIGEMLRSLGNLVQNLKLENHVIFKAEFIPENERILHYAACDVAVFPSLYEPFGIVSLEAMSMGKPVVVGAAGISGMREQVVPSGSEQCGIHINPQDPNDIAWGVLSVLNDKSVAKTMGANARQRVLKYFTWDIATKCTLRVYEELVKKGELILD